LPTLGRQEFTRSLRTPIYGEARARAVLLDAQVERLFAVLRGGGVDRRYVDRLIEKLCDDFLRQWIDGDREIRRKAESGLDPEMQSFVYTDLLEEESGRMQAGDRSSVVEHARELLDRAGVQSLEGEDFERLCWELQRTLLRAYRICGGEWEGDFTGQARDQEQSASPAPRAEERHAGGKMLSEVITAWIGDHEGKTWTPRTAKQIKGVIFSVFLPLVGDQWIGEVRREDIRKFREALERLPKRTEMVWRGRTAREVLELQPTPSGLSPKTVNKWIGFVAGFFKWAERMEYIDRNPASGMMRPTKRHEEREKRQPFTDEDLRRLFTAEFRRKTLDQGKFGKYWVPLLCLFTGARVSEMAQLRVGDVGERDGVPVLDIREGEGQTLKTATSARTVPIHSGLVALGFLDYVEEARSGSWARLFPELPEDGANGPGDSVSKFFGRWRRKVGIDDPKKVLHSCRHTVATRLKQADVQEHVIAELLGHEHEHISTGRYGKKLDVRNLADAVERLDYEKALRGLQGTRT
jgi:integrase